MWCINVPAGLPVIPRRFCTVLDWDQALLELSFFLNILIGEDLDNDPFGKKTTLAKHLIWPIFEVLGPKMKSNVL